MTRRDGFDVLHEYRARLKPGWRIEHDINHEDPNKHFLTLLSPDQEQVSGYRREGLFRLLDADSLLIEVIDSLLNGDDLEEDAEGLYHLPGQAEPVADIITFPTRKPGGPTP